MCVCDLLTHHLPFLSPTLTRGQALPEIKPSLPSFFSYQPLSPSWRNTPATCHYAQLFFSFHLNSPLSLSVIFVMYGGDGGATLWYSDLTAASFPSAAYRSSPFLTAFVLFYITYIAACFHVLVPALIDLLFFSFLVAFSPISSLYSLFLLCWYYPVSPPSGNRIGMRVTQSPTSEPRAC